MVMRVMRIRGMMVRRMVLLIMLLVVMVAISITPFFSKKGDRLGLHRRAVAVLGNAKAEAAKALGGILGKVVKVGRLTEQFVG